MSKIENLKLRDILRHINAADAPEELEIQYRTHGVIGGEKYDLLAGYCKYNFATGELIAEDGDSYSLDDEIEEFCMEMYDPEDEDSDVYLCVWYESKWM